jgi:hypothetical protein
MSPAERKRKQRERQRKEKTDVPSWLRLRREIWQFVQERFMFANVQELSNALEALAKALVATNVFQLYGEPADRFFHQFNSELVERPEAIAVFQEIAPYVIDPDILQKFPAIKDRMLFDLLRDFLGESHKSETLD